MTKKYYRDDDDEDKAVDAALAGHAPEVIVPLDMLEQATAPGEGSMVNANVVQVSQEGKALVTAAQLSDDELAAELARRKTVKIDQHIAELELQLFTLQGERNLLLGNPLAVLLASPQIHSTTNPGVNAKPMTNVNPVTGKARPPAVKPRPASVLTKDCTCDGEGCYLCMK